MSFYDFTKDFVLSAKELFKYRVKRDTTIPSKGGQKDFEPDGSWMQSKAVEAFMQERTSVLSEPRVEKLKNLVQGVWDAEQRLVNLHKPGKFWAHMGFTDQRRNWLYPEEALFLMESNTLEVYSHGVVLSIQEAFDVFLGADVSLEEYQVFSHLRRLGYVVLRHQQHPVISPYERQLNLDKYMSKQSFKDRKGKFLQKGKMVVKQRWQNNEQLDDGQQTMNFSAAAKSANTAGDEDFGSKEGDHEGNLYRDNEGSFGKDKQDSGDIENKRTSDTCPSQGINSTEGDYGENQWTDQSAAGASKEHGSDSLHLQSSKRSKPDSGDCSSPVNARKAHSELTEDGQGLQASQPGLSGPDTACRFYDNQWLSCFLSQRTSWQSVESAQGDHRSEEAMDTEQPTQPHTAATDAGQTGTSEKSVCVSFPNIGGQNFVKLCWPTAGLLPDHVQIPGQQQHLLCFDVEEYRQKNPPRAKNRRAQKEEERDARSRGLEFSFAEWMHQKPEMWAKNWREYKASMSKIKAERATSTPVDHLWKGKVTPLVRPQDASSLENILNCLRIIKPAENESLLPDSDCLLDVKVTYDLHLPDNRFKKSMPGIPSHRVCVTKCSSKPPGLAQLQQVWSRFTDEVPLLWAVVDSGEIAFYCFDGCRTIQALS